MFELLKETSLGRRGRIMTDHGPIDTPVFFPVGTAGAMRGITLDDISALGSQVLLCNTYHLHLQPGEKVVADAGGLHEFIGWKGPILTDSGGFQVFSLSGLRKIEEHGVRFQSHIDGSPLFLGPEEAMRIQHALGSDIIMCFDECPPSTAERSAQVRAVEGTIRWAKECKKWHEQLLKEKPADAPTPNPKLFAIVQGGLHTDLRQRCAKELIEIGFDGYAIGGLAVGETEEEMYAVPDAVVHLPAKDKPRYPLGLRRLHQHRIAISKGIDMFDCVLPMREARHGKVYLSDGSTFNALNSEFKNDHSIIDPDSPSSLSRVHKKSYLAHLFRAKERMAETIACMQNMAMTLQAIQKLRDDIERS